MVGNTRLAKAVMMLELVWVLMAAVRLTSATQYKVGDADGWRIGKANYTTWAGSKTFYVGDSLLFVYNKVWHNTLQVTETDYDSCKNSSPIATYADGNDIVPLPKTGIYYYLCGIPGHCEAGQKVAINVLAANDSAPSFSPETAPSPSSAAPEKSKSAAPSPSPSLISHNRSHAPAPESASKSNAHAKSAGSALLAFIWALGALLFCQ